LVAKFSCYDDSFEGPINFVYFKPPNTDNGTCTNGSPSIAGKSTGAATCNDRSTDHQTNRLQSINISHRARICASRSLDFNMRSLYATLLRLKHGLTST